MDKNMPTKVLVFAASNSRTSINRQLAEHSGRVLSSEVMTVVEVETLDLNDFEMPIYSAERAREGGIPALAQAFRDRISTVEGVIVSFPEHNGTYSAAFKNIFDWVSRIDMAVYQKKPVVFLATSPGGRAGRKVLEFATQTAPFFGAEVAGTLAIGPFAERFDADRGELTDAEDASALRGILKAFQQALEQRIAPVQTAA